MNPVNQPKALNGEQWKFDFVIRNHNINRNNVDYKEAFKELTKDYLHLHLYRVPRRGYYPFIEKVHIVTEVSVKNGQDPRCYCHINGRRNEYLAILMESDIEIFKKELFKPFDFLNNKKNNNNLAIPAHPMIPISPPFASIPDGGNTATSNIVNNSTTTPYTDIVNNSTTTVSLETDGYCFVPVFPGTSKLLNDLVRSTIIGTDTKYEEKDVTERISRYCVPVFTCHKDTYEILSKKGINTKGLTTFDDSYTDKRRVQLYIGTAESNTRGYKLKQNREFQTLMKEVERVAREKTNKNNFTLTKEVLLVTLPDARRQQLHRDWEDIEKDRFFLLLPLQENQTLIIMDDNHEIKSVKLPIDTVFIGHARLVHAGSDKQGLRLHAVLVPTPKKESSSQNEYTNYIIEKNYPDLSL